MLRPRPHLAGLEPCVHGGPDRAELAELGLQPEDILDFSVNCNPLGPPPGLREALSRISWQGLPDPQATRLRGALAAALGVRPSNILVGNGSVELIRFLALTFFGPGDRVVVPEPTFGEYLLSVQIAGAQALAPRVLAEAGFQPNVDGIIGLIRNQQARGVFLCNPNNPTGVYLSQEEVERILAAGPDCLLVLDEAYVPFVEGAWPSLELLPRGNLIILRSMTKDYALGGLRLGYALGPEPLMATLGRMLPPWSTNALAQEAGILALQDTDHVARSRQVIAEGREYLARELASMGLKTFPSVANFLLVEVGEASAFRRSLLRQGLLVRDCTSFGLPGHVRISVRTLGECQRLVEAVRRLAAARAGGGP